ncbi:hypothetical protein F4811DRAFT_325611 [Daldinia bambusicola]|nr:hypothetical protein F4811DRAFT_325611 [Daldinia bambusicola]
MYTKYEITSAVFSRATFRIQLSNYLTLKSAIHQILTGSGYTTCLFQVHYAANAGMLCRLWLLRIVEANTRLTRRIHSAANYSPPISQYRNLRCGFGGASRFLHGVLILDRDQSSSRNPFRFLQPYSICLIYPLWNLCLLGTNHLGLFANK